MSVSENFRPDAKAVAESMRPVLDAMEKDRLETLATMRKATLTSALIFGSAAFAGMVFYQVDANAAGPGIVIAGAGMVIALVVYLVTCQGKKTAFLARFKSEVFTAAVRTAVPGIEYHPSSMVPQSSFERGGLFDSRIDRYQGEDCFNGKFGATDLMFSELNVRREETSTDSKGNTTTRTITVFNGIYLIADFHKEFACRVMIEPDVAEASFGWLGRKMQGLSGNLVRLENPEFEQAFKVTSDDAVGARYLLTPDMQERFLALRNDWAKDIRAVLMDSSLHLAIPKREDWFEARIDVPADDVPTLHSFLVRLMIVLKITETLDLNTRIWTKE